VSPSQFIFLKLKKLSTDMIITMISKKKNIAVVLFMIKHHKTQAQKKTLMRPCACILDLVTQL